MSVGAATAVLATVFAWSVFSHRLERWGLSGPMVFVAAGLAFSGIFDLLNEEFRPEPVKLLAEVTLVWVLFADASRVELRQLRHDLGTYVRLLGVGLPLTVVLGTVTAAWLLGLGAWSALLVGAALAPTDAALGAAVMTNPRVPERIRRVLNVESGLNDGIATPVVLIAIAGVAADEGISGLHEHRHAAVALLLGVVAGIVVGGLGGALLGRARRLGWVTDELAGPGVLALALLAYSAALLVEGNGFVAAFVGGLTFGAVAGRGGKQEIYFVEQTGQLASMLSWLVFGVLSVPIIGDAFSWRVVVYAVLSLTLIRMVPVALSLLGTEFDRLSVGFIGWFGPRGLASVIFALLAMEELDAASDTAVATIAVTVLLSVVAHGVTAVPLVGRFGAEGDRRSLAVS